ncbi:hypothetical protein [Streptomyces katsurahamanus]|nr:hypothetical protein [Streptomyces katsurahamanus]
MHVRGISRQGRAARSRTHGGVPLYGSGVPEPAVRDAGLQDAGLRAVGR